MIVNILLECKPIQCQTTFAFVSQCSLTACLLLILDFLMSDLISVEFGKLSVVGSLNSNSNAQKESLSKQSPFPVISMQLHVVHYGWTLNLSPNLLRKPDPPFFHLHPHSKAKESLCGPQIALSSPLLLNERH